MFKFIKKLFGKKKVFVLGIDGAPPELVFDKWIDELPNIKSLMKNSVYGKLKSSIPPSTIVAWSSMLTGKDPSHFDVYSYTTKDEHNNSVLTNSKNVKDKRIWKYMDENNKKSILLNIPLTYPVEEVNGIMLSGFLTPKFNEKAVYPLEIKNEILSQFHDYAFDVGVGLAGYKNIESKQMITAVNKMTMQQLKITKDFLKKEWDFFMTVLIGSDRMQHTMWRFMDEKHRRYEESEFKDSIKDYYKYLDREIGDLKSQLDEDTYFFILSDHGFDRMDGRFNLNDWLIQEGYLVMKEDIQNQEKLDFKKVNWDKTKAYAVGAYFGRIYFNKVDIQDELIEKLKHIKNDRGEEMDTVFHKPKEVYSGEYLESSPDLYVFFDNLRWGVNNDVGNEGLYSEKTTKGSDDAGHAPNGLFLLNHNSITEENINADILDILPTILNIYEIKHNLEGKNLIKVS